MIAERQSTPDDRREIIELVDLCLSGNIDDEQLLRLQQLVIDDRQSGLDYVRYIYDSMHLQQWIAASKDSARSEFDLDVLTAELCPEEVCPATAPPQTSCMTLSTGEASCTAEEAASSDRATSDLHVLSSTIARRVGGLDWRTRPRQVFIVSLALTLAFWAVVVAVVWPSRNGWDLAQRPGVQPVESIEPVVAELVEACDVVWASDSSLRPTVGTSLRQGDQLILTAGIVQLRFETGASITVEGPGRFALSQKNAAYMQLGRMFARAPGDAVGFTVETPAAKVIDLGTEFGVMVQRDGTTEVHVFSGLVEATPRTPSQRSSHDHSLVLEEGKAVRITMAQGELQTLAANREGFARLKRPGWFVLGQPTVVASSQERADTAPLYVFDGDPGTRWSSEHTDNQWIYIDLGQDYVLQKVAIDWETAHAEDYKLLVRTADQGIDKDPTNWTEIASVNGRRDVDGDGGRFDDTFDFDTATFESLVGTAQSSSVASVPMGRYLMVHGLTRATEYGHSIFEVSILTRTPSAESEKKRLPKSSH